MTDPHISKAETAKVVSKASFAEFPNNAPLHAAFRTIRLRNGTLPPAGSMPLRIAFGVAETPERAALLAGFEAIERYALQYSKDGPEIFESVLASDGNLHSLPGSRLLLGSPVSIGQIDSKGAAAGPSPEAAAMAAIFEFLEHQLDSQNAYSHIVPQDAVPTGLNAWLKRQLRLLSIHAAPLPDVGVLVRAVCSDFLGGRPTFGTAFSANFFDALNSAIGEAVVSWRNMVTLEFNGITTQEMGQQEKRLFEIYRGAQTNPFKTPDRVLDPSELRTPNLTLRDALAVAATVNSGPVGVFDLTVEEIPLPVAKVVAV